MDDALLQTIRQAPLFAGVKDDQLDCIRRGEVIQVPAGTILVAQDEPAEFFFLNLEGEVRISRQYDNQEVLLGVNRPGMFMGEIPLLLNSPWLAIVRVSKPARLFRLNQENFWHMIEHVSFGRPGSLPNRRQSSAQPGGLFPAARETGLARHHGRRPGPRAEQSGHGRPPRRRPSLIKPSTPCRPCSASSPKC